MYNKIGKYYRFYVLTFLYLVGLHVGLKRPNAVSNIVIVYLYHAFEDP